MPSPPPTMTAPLAAPAGGQPPYIGTVVVTFNPDPARLLEVIAAIAPQVSEILVVDNGSGAPPASYLRKSAQTPLFLLELGDNYGIAAAQNLGLAWLRGRDASHALILDQDAVAAPGMVGTLFEEMQSHETRGERVAAVGPLICDPRRHAPAPFFRVTRFGMQRITTPDSGERSCRTDFLISAGALLALQALDDIGPMDEALFIDYVDLEWCMRATHRGYRLYGHHGTRIDHRLGEEPLCFLGRRFMSHSPLRHYYMSRNALALWRMPHARFGWKCFDALALALRGILFSTLAPRRAEHLRMVLRGISDGLRGKQGRQDQAATGWQVPDEVRRRAPRAL